MGEELLRMEKAEISEEDEEYFYKLLL